MFKYSDLDYDEFYDSEHCKRENAEIKSALDSICESGDRVLDLGAGTGLVSSMIGGKCKITQVEKDEDMRKQNLHPNFIACDATEFLDRRCPSGVYDHVVSLFALNYMKRGTLTKAVAAANGECLFVIYDRPYKKGSASYYRGKKFEFLRKCKIGMWFIDREINKLEHAGYRVCIWNLCGEPYYKVVLVKKPVMS